MLEDVRDRQYLITMHKKAKKSGLDMSQYNTLKREIADLEEDLRRLRDPLYLHVPAVPKKFHYAESDGGIVPIGGEAKSKFRNLMDAVKGKIANTTTSTTTNTTGNTPQSPPTNK